MSMRYPGGLIATSPVNARYPSGVWTQAQAIPYQSQNVWTRDRFWPNTTLLLQGDGATNGAQNNTFLDSSSNNFTITRNGNTTQGAFTPYEQNGYWSNYFEGTSNTNYLSIARLLDSNVDVTLECWVFMTASQPTNGAYVAAQFTAGGADRTVFGVIGAGNLVGMQFGTTSVTSTAAIQLNQWVHLAWVRSGNGTNNWSQYINGVRDGQLTYTGTYQNTPFTIGASNNIASSQFPGYISNMRLVKGTAVYSGTSFTPPSAPLTAITNTVLLTCQGNRFLDSSASPNTITVNGTPSVQAFQPFPGATTWSASVLGGSGYFDGTGDYLTAPDNAVFDFGSGDYTIEMWVVPATTTPSAGLVVKRASSAVYAPINVGFGGSLAPAYLVSFNGSTWGINITSSISCSANAWNHIAVTRSGSTFTIWVNGQSGGTGTSASAVMTNTAAISIGATAADGSSAFNGYISNVRLVKGTAVYTSTFTPPTAPLTAIANTSLLLSMTNAGIYDNSMMNNLETVGNAQVSTSVVKYGTGSMAFDGSGDNLSLISQPPLYLSTGDFTIEMWLYTTTATTSQQVFIRRSSVTARGMAMTISGVASQKITFLAGDTNTSAWEVTLTSGTSLASNTWYHVAVTRNGSNFTLWLNGVSEATASSSVTIADDTSNFLIGVTDSASAYLNGYLDDFRITKGVARYITSFTPPPARLPAQ